MLVPLLALALAGSALSACGRAEAGGRVHVVASFYPLAWAAERVGGDRIEVVDLTPPGGEAHDSILNARQVAELQTADVVLLLGRFGFQPNIEAAAAQASGDVVDVTRGLSLAPAEETGLTYDPHVWLDPVLMASIVSNVERGLAATDPAGRPDYEANADALREEIRGTLGGSVEGLGPACDFRTFVVTHEAFAYLASRAGLAQLGIEGIAPESEPTSDRIQAAGEAIARGSAGPAIFYEATDEGRRIGESVASDIGVRALPLYTLEQAPATGDYLSAMEENLASLREGLLCPS